MYKSTSKFNSSNIYEFLPDDIEQDIHHMVISYHKDYKNRLDFMDHIQQVLCVIENDGPCSKDKIIERFKEEFQCTDKDAGKDTRKLFNHIITNIDKILVIMIKEGMIEFS